VAGRFVTCFPLEFSERKFETDPSLEYRSAYLQCSEAVEALVRGEAVNEFARGFGERNQLERFFNVNAAIPLVEIRCSYCAQLASAAMPPCVYEVRPRKDKRSVDLISDVLPFGRPVACTRCASNVAKLRDFLTACRLMKLDHGLPTIHAGAAAHALNERCAVWLPTFAQCGIHFVDERTDRSAFNNLILFDRVHPAIIGRRAAKVEGGSGNVIETHEHKGDFKEWPGGGRPAPLF
jgi:hypothetical protein